MQIYFSQKTKDGDTQAVSRPAETASQRWGEYRKAYSIVQKCLHFSCDEQETLLPEMLLFGRAGRSIRFGASSLVPFLTRQERNRKRFENSFSIQITNKTHNINYILDSDTFIFNILLIFESWVKDFTIRSL
ncbi:hypothetical protein LA303_06440 [Candidatus Sulfidibacterium hydrothermale]|uniref:hypothetical protein n=1 Tax=Candidatus Sulfidibacterium hydrothermale TaxID=2875962 RepID=UPI001F0ACA83|nr:hypothetical protein [Candidatus Sulfidibacterium hydrothermale]UBM61064.1 hypothetical protein LA303_06440 [Candidatus Sulfidibacterium hydrothermale]